MFTVGKIIKRIIFPSKIYVFQIFQIEIHKFFGSFDYIDTKYIFLNHHILPCFVQNTKTRNIVFNFQPCYK